MANLQLHLPLDGIASVEFDGFTSADFERSLSQHGFSVASVGSPVGDDSALVYQCKYPTKFGEVEVEFSLPEDYSAIAKWSSYKLGDLYIRMVVAGIQSKIESVFPPLFDWEKSPYYRRGAIAAEQLLLQRGVLKNRRVAR